MSYHGHPPPYYNKVGIGVVNPLHRIERKLAKIRSILDDISENTVLTAYDLKIKLAKVIEDG